MPKKNSPDAAPGRREAKADHANPDPPDAAILAPTLDPPVDSHPIYDQIYLVPRIEESTRARIFALCRCEQTPKDVATIAWIEFPYLIPLPAHLFKLPSELAREALLCAAEMSFQRKFTSWREVEEMKEDEAYLNRFAKMGRPPVDEAIEKLGPLESEIRDEAMKEVEVFLNRIAMMACSVRSRAADNKLMAVKREIHAAADIEIKKLRIGERAGPEALKRADIFETLIEDTLKTTVLEEIEDEIKRSGKTWVTERRIVGKPALLPLLEYLEAEAEVKHYFGQAPRQRLWLKLRPKADITLLAGTIDFSQFDDFWKHITIDPRFTPYLDLARAYAADRLSDPSPPPPDPWPDGWPAPRPLEERETASEAAARAVLSIVKHGLEEVSEIKSGKGGRGGRQRDNDRFESLNQDIAKKCYTLAVAKDHEYNNVKSMKRCYKQMCKIRGVPSVK
jgi:hypothetical protein